MALLFIAQNVACTSHTVDLTNWWCRGVTTSTCTRCWSTTERPFQNKLSAWFASTLSIRGTQGATICISATKRTRTRSDGSWNSSKCLQNAQFIIISWTDSIKKISKEREITYKNQNKIQSNRGNVKDVISRNGSVILVVLNEQVRYEWLDSLWSRRILVSLKLSDSCAIRHRLIIFSLKYFSYAKGRTSF